MFHLSTDFFRTRHRYCAIVFALALLPALGRAQTLPYTISTMAGTCSANSTPPPPCLGGYSGDGGSATSAVLNGPSAVVFDSSGNLYIADTDNNRVRKVSGGTISTVAGNGTAGFAGDGSSATASGTELNAPSGLAFDSSGNMYIADADNYEVRKVTGGTISTVAGDNSKGAGFAGDLGAATNAQLWNPSGVAVDSAGNIYIADPYNNVVRVVCVTQGPVACTNNNFIGGTTWSSGDINTLAGNETTGANYTGDGGIATGSSLNNPVSVLLDPAGNLYISDSGNNVIRKIDTSGIITTVVGDGSGNPGYLGDGGPATQAELNTPKGLALDSAGNLYIADCNNFVIRMVTPDGTIYTIAGNGQPGYSGDGGAATSATLWFPSGVAVNGGNVYVADNGNNVIRLLTPVVETPLVNSGGVITASSFGASTTVTPGSWIEIYGKYLANTSTEWGSANFSGSTAPTSLGGTSVTVGGKPAYVSYVSPGQVNVQVPSSISAGTQPLVVTTASGSSTSYNLKIGQGPSLYAPSLLDVGGQQYAGALFANSSTWVLPTGAVSGLTSKPAVAGDIITLYGVGFGDATPQGGGSAIPAGQLVGSTELTSLTSPVTIMFGTTPGTMQYQGLAPAFVGLYQFNVVVPSGVSGDAVPLTFTQGGVTGSQTLYTAVAPATN
ncbi:MAG TPA: hypothetical protein VMT86_04495 [Bryobacteraceae bacterium]|nr:hypothetical protein [Bryobacteraceae bacterium]